MAVANETARIRCALHPPPSTALLLRVAWPPPGGRLDGSSWPRLPALDVTPDQLRLGRIALRWSQAELARESGLSRTTVANLEVGRIRRSTLAAIVRALERNGVELAEDGGVRPLDKARSKV